MSSSPPPSDKDPEGQLALHAEALSTGIDECLAGWVVRCVEQRLVEWAGSVTDDIADQAARAGEEARTEVAPRVAAMLHTDIDSQRVSPLAVVREAIRYPTEVLAAAGVPPVVRDEVDERLHPDDHYGLAPANFGDIDPRLAEPGLAWGAAKAFVHLARRRAEGLR